MRLASGICPTLELTAAGAPLGLGVDGSASNDASNMILETRQALYIQRLRYGAQAITPERVLGWATQGSAQLLGRSDIGALAVGKIGRASCRESVGQYVMILVVGVSLKKQLHYNH